MSAYSVSQKVVHCSRGCCGGAVALIVLVFIWLHRSSSNLEFETLFDSIWQIVADSW